MNAALYWYLRRAVAEADNDELTEGMNAALDLIEQKVPHKELLSAKPEDFNTDG